MQQAGRLDAVQVQGLEGKMQDEGDRLRHVALSGIRLSHPVPDAPALRHAAPDVGERDAAEQPVGALLEDEEGEAGAGTPVLAEAPMPPPVGGRGRRVRRPGRLPGNEEVTAEVA